jgi:hypothetical protein
MMQSSIDDIMCADACELTVGAGAGVHSMNKRWMIFSRIVVLNSRESWHFRSIKRSSDTFGSVLWTPYAVLPWVVWGSCAIFLAWNLNNFKYWFLCRNHPNPKFFWSHQGPTTRIHSFHSATNQLKSAEQPMPSIDCSSVIV